MSKHTPGPWYLDEVSADDWQVNSDLHDHCLFQITPTIGVQSLTDEDKANARLIAASPDLLATLNEIVSQIDQGGAGGKVFARDACITAARRAIAKAKGANHE